MKLYEIYKEILIKEVGEGTSEPFEYENNGGDDENFSYTIYGEVKDENNDKVLAKVPIKLQSLGFPIQVDYEHGDWEIDGDIDNIAQEKGKFFNVSPGTTLKAMEIIFSRMDKKNAFEEVNNRVFMFRLMATIKNVLYEEFAKNGKPDIITYSPNKKGNEDIDQTGRHKLYNAFIKKAFPNAHVFIDDRSDEIMYKLK